jgi:hypothetical protein
MHQEMVIKEALTSDITAGILMFKELTSFHFDTSYPNKNNTKRIQKSLIGILDKIMSGEITKTEFERARNYLLGYFMRSVESTGYTGSIKSFNLAILEFINGISATPEEYIDMVNKINYKYCVHHWKKKFRFENSQEGFVFPKSL